MWDEYDLKAFARLFDKTDVQDNGCWNFTGHCNLLWDQGQFWYKGKNRKTSRMAYYFCVDELSEDIQVLHTCDNPKCINPAHLFTGDNQDNSDDKVAKGRQSRGETNGRAKLTASAVVQIREQASIKSASELASEFEIPRCTIYDIINYRTWKHL